MFRCMTPYVLPSPRFRSLRGATGVASAVFLLAGASASAERRTRLVAKLDVGVSAMCVDIDRTCSLAAAGGGRDDGDTSSGRVRVWRIRGRKCLWSHDTGRRVVCVEFVANGRTLVSVSDVVTMWDARSGARVRSFPVGNDCSSGSVSRDGRYVVCVEHNSTRAVVYRTTDGSVAFTISKPAAENSLDAAAFSPSGSRVASIGSGLGDNLVGYATLSRVDSGKALRTFTAVNKYIFAIGFATDDLIGTVQASADLDMDTVVDMRIYLDRVSSGRRVNSFKVANHNKTVAALAFSRNGRWLAYSVSSGIGDTIRVREIGTGRELALQAGRMHFVRCLKFSANSALIATAGEDGRAEIWSIGGSIGS